MKQTTDQTRTTGGMSRFRVGFHDYVHGRISFSREVDSPTIGAAVAIARAGIVMPDYVIANHVTALEGGDGSWSSLPPDDRPEPPMLKVELSDPEIRELTRLSPEEVYNSGFGYDAGTVDTPLSTGQDRATLEEVETPTTADDHDQDPDLSDQVGIGTKL